MQIIEFIKDYWFLITAFGSLLIGGYKSVKTLNETLVSIKHQLELNNKNHEYAVKESSVDRGKLWSEVSGLKTNVDGIDTRVTILEHRKGA